MFSYLRPNARALRDTAYVVVAGVAEIRLDVWISRLDELCVFETHDGLAVDRATLAPAVGLTASIPAHLSFSL